MDNIILIGMPGSGKSSVGIELAKALSRPFLDVDLLIERREGAPLQTVLDRNGVARFLDLERDAICSLDCRDSVIAPGGSCVCREEAIAHMRRLGTVVYLELSLPEVEQRINNLATRGIALEPGQTLEDIYADRTPRYRRCAHITVSAGKQSLAETVKAVERAVRMGDRSGRTAACEK